MSDSVAVIGARRAARYCGAVVVAGVLGACSEARSEGPLVTRETIGDTTVVRVMGAGGVQYQVAEEIRIGELDGADEYTFGRIEGLATGEDGTIFVLDAQALEVRVYDAHGRFVRRFGRSGGGPGELKQPSGMLLLGDGRLVVRDAGNSRMNVYSQTGTSLTSWSIPGGFFTSAPIFTDRAGNTYTDIIAERRDDGGWISGLLRLDSLGAVVDTIRRPLQEYTAPQLRAEHVVGESRSVSITGVPFWPQAQTTLNLDGEFVGGIADRYAVHTWHRDGRVLRIERDVSPVAVAAREAETAVERTTRNMRRTQDNWKWDGPRPPATKPAFKSLRVANDGRIWVNVSAPAVHLPPDPDATPDPAGLPPLDRWTEPLIYDVFEENGDFVGTVEFPDRFRPLVMSGDHVWGVSRDEFDVQYVTRLRLTPSPAGVRRRP